MTTLRSGCCKRVGNRRYLKFESITRPLFQHDIFCTIEQYNYFVQYKNSPLLKHNIVTPKLCAHSYQLECAHNLLCTVWSKCVCKYPNAQFTSSGNGIPVSSNGTHFRPFTDPTSGNFPFCTVPKLAICHYWYWA